MTAKRSRSGGNVSRLLGHTFEVAVIIPTGIGVSEKVALVPIGRKVCMRACA